MSANEVMTTSPTGAQKAENEERYDLIPVEPLRLLAQHFGRGAKKYADRNWELGIEWRKNFASATRHMQQFWGGEDIDPETGTPHVISAAWHMFALAEYMTTHPELDDRPSTVVKPKYATGGIIMTPHNPLLPSGGTLPHSPQGVLHTLNSSAYAEMAVDYESHPPTADEVVGGHPTRVSAMTLRYEPWTRAYVWTNGPWEYHWLRNGYRGDGWYARGGDLTSYCYSSVNEPSFVYDDPFERLQ